jgi:hypothetical protein
MASKAQTNRVGKMVAEVETLAKRLRADLRKRVRAANLPRNLNKMAADLRRRAAGAAAQVEKYVHEIRIELESTPGRKPARSRAKAKKR